MSRITRAALRSNAPSEHPDLAASVPSPSTARKERAPLGEIAGNVVEDSRTDGVSNGTIKAKKKGPAKLKKGKASRKVKLENTGNNEAREEVLKDNDETAESSAVEEACDILIIHSEQGRYYP